VNEIVVRISVDSHNVSGVFLDGIEFDDTDQISNVECDETPTLVFEVIIEEAER
jgi:hypothetical protein